MLRCPHCRKKIEDELALEQIDPAKISAAAHRLMGRKGRGASKARTPEQARAAALAMWVKKRASATILTVLALAAFALAPARADLFKVHYSVHGGGHDIQINASSSDQARYTVQDMIPDAVVTSVSRARR